MRGPTIGFYVHYHGLGHKHRTEAILQHLQIPATVVTSRIDTLDWNGPTLQQVVGIACDIDDVSPRGIPYARDVQSLHYAPLWCETITRRVAQYTAWLDAACPDVMVVDVSAEISMLTRLASIPQVVMRQHGDRNDPAHQDAYRAAHSMLAPFPKSMEDDQTPDWVRTKTIYLDGFCRQQSAPKDDRETVAGDGPAVPTIVVMFGRGGNADVHVRLAAAARRVPEYRWQVIGIAAPESTAPPDNLQYVGWVDDPMPYVTGAEIVVTAAGHNSVMELGHARQRLIAIAQQRPFDEQICKAAILDREGLAIGLSQWPDTDQWPDLLQRAERLAPRRWDAIFAGDGAAQAAAHLHRVATWSRRQRESNRRAVPCS
ncbi:MurG-like transferase [Rosistilla carotiformis]|uniref:MurG-like transferase n=1 Tax=Rosistilla carotiformis TaxID=2528017 RepID=A0A518JSQ7_9BACT|nr:glycosyl transferase family 28 protein [Rosistilla carotiformis]QDV68576.1 MurG-like transferase [Rosistilla carotiformis]